MRNCSRKVIKIEIRSIAVITFENHDILINHPLHYLHYPISNNKQHLELLILIRDN
jgi:hypothetical protein